MHTVSKPSGQGPDVYQKQINLDLLRLKEIVVFEIERFNPIITFESKNRRDICIPKK